MECIGEYEMWNGQALLLNAGFNGCFAFCRPRATIKQAQGFNFTRHPACNNNMPPYL